MVGVRRPGEGDAGGLDGAAHQPRHRLLALQPQLAMNPRLRDEVGDGVGFASPPLGGGGARGRRGGGGDIPSPESGGQCLRRVAALPGSLS
eukprot:2246790-Pyramimonas_sp.AAC.1